jgi:type VI secretion system protein ImpK
MREYGDTFLLAPFREFYREVIRLKRMVKTGAWVSPPPSGADVGAEDLQVATGTWVYFPDVIPATELEAEPDVATGAWVAPIGDVPPWARPEHKGNGANSSPTEPQREPLAPAEHIKISTFVWQKLLSLFERQEAYAWRYGGTYGAEFYKEAQYVMVALADEIFLHTEWEGRRVWVSNLLETKIFQSHVAGEQFFQKLDRLLQDRDPVYRDLAAVYLMALSLGFRGKYRGSDDRGVLTRYRKQLYSFVFRHEADLGNESKHLFPEAYYHTLREETKKRLPNPRAWIILFCFVVLAYVLFTHGLWLNLTKPLGEANERIERSVDEMGNRR